LRLDQRIQQLFSVMNEIIRKAGFPGRKPLLKTYKVIPMTSSVGIIEWVNDTKPLKSVLEGEQTEEEKKTKIAALHSAWISEGSKEPTQGYLNSYSKRSREQTIQHLHDLYTHVRWNLLKTAIYKLSASPEAFLSIRSRFGESLASINVCSYLLGIGDRHLDNFLVDMNRYF
jgi:DNA-dependent protein kinase catalytic subunit